MRRLTRQTLIAVTFNLIKKINRFSKVYSQGFQVNSHRSDKRNIHKLWRNKRIILVVIMLTSSTLALTLIGVQRVIKNRHSATISTNSVAKNRSSNKALNATTTTNSPLTKLREYVYAGGRMLSSEEKSCVPALTPGGANIAQGGGTGSINVSTSSGCNWGAISNASWITITSAANGLGNGAISYSVAANSGEQRSSTISINGQAFTITQAPSPGSCGYVLNKSSESISDQGGNGALTLFTGAGCHWTASSNSSWLSLTSATSGNSSATINYSVTANSGQQRSGIITVGGQNFTVTQAPNQASCTFALNPGSQSFNAGGGSGSFTVTTGAGCNWSGSITDGWITIAGGATGIGNGTVSFNVQTNNGASRTSTISVQGQSFTITQCGYQVSPTYDSYSYTGGTGSITVSSCSAWSAVSNDEEWITITSGTSGVGNGTVNYTVSRNYTQGGDGRDGSITVAGVTVTISQLPTSCRCTPWNLECCEESMMSLSSGSDPGQNAPRLRQIIRSQQLLLLLVCIGLLLLTTRGVLFIINRQLKRKWLSVTAICSDVKLFMHCYVWFRTVFGFINRKITKLLIEMAETINEQTRLLLNSPKLLGFKLQLHRALTIVIIVSMTLPATQAQAQSLGYTAKSIWENVRTSLEHASLSIRRFTFFSSAVQAEQVASLQICPKQLIMYVGERYTITPIPLNSSQQVVHGVGISFNSLNSTIVSITTFGNIGAVATGNATIEVQSGNITKQIPIEVRSGTRPVGSNQQADLDTTDCAAEQSSMFSSQTITDASVQQSAIPYAADGVLLDWDPEAIPNSRAAYFRNAVGNPRFAAKKGNTLLGSSNYQFNVPVVSVGGRGVSANIGMSFNSRVWNIDDGKATFNYVGAYPAPGWSMGYGKIIRNYNATGTGNLGGVGTSNNPGDYLLVSGGGTRTHLKAKYDTAIGKWFHDSEDGSFLRFYPTSGEMRYPDGSKMIYSSVNGVLLPTAIINTNGGAITMSYRDYCEGSCLRVFRHRTALSAVRDTLGRYVTFHYYGDIDYPADTANGKPQGELAAIKAPNMDGVQQEVIRVEYQSITLKYDFGSISVEAPANNSQIQVVRRIYYPQTGKGYLFQDYSSYGMPRKISHRYAMTGTGGAITDGTEIAYTKYNYTTIDPNDPYGRNQTGSLNDFPQFTRREEWWLGKTDASGNPTNATTKYDYSRTTNSSTEISTIKYVDRNVEEVTTTGNDSNQISYGKVISVEQKNSTTGAVLGKQIYTYIKGPDGEDQIEKVETIDEAGQGKLIRTAYGHYGRVIDQYEYGYKQGTEYKVQRRARYDYIDDQSYIAERFLRLVNRVSIYDAKNNNNDSDDELKGKSETIYDDYAAMGGIHSYGLSSATYPPNHDGTYDQNKLIRGNTTGIITFSKLSPEESIRRNMKFDVFGNVIEAEVSCCVKKTFNFSSTTKYSQPDSVRSGGGTGLSLESFYQYNYFTGLVLNETNPDGLVTYYEYDRVLRLKKITSPTGAVTVAQLEQDSNGNDLLTSINQTIYNDQGVDKVVTSKQWFNGLGQVIRAGTGTGYSPGSYDMVMAIYDNWGRPLKSSNPYAGDAYGDLQSGITQYWTTSTYDDFSRVIKVTLPDNQFIQTEYSGATGTTGATVISTDTVGRKRKSEVDGLGRLIKVTEQNPANGNLDLDTIYSYDLGDNLTKIDQGGQIRSFSYDAKGRLTSQTLPENGTTTYTYTDFDAISTRTDARNVVTTYNYGSLNMLTGVSHNTTNATGVAATSAVNITYKNTSPAKGQIETVTDGVGSENYSYNNLGRLQSNTRVIDGISYGKSYEYNSIGQITLMSYPSGKRVKVTHDVRGRLNAIQSIDPSNFVQETYLSEINYRVEGLVSSQKIGDGSIENFGYSNDRLQLTSQIVTKSSNTLLSLNYGYQAANGQMGSGSVSGNTGQLVNITGIINGQNRNQAFTYDNVGRLSTATGSGAWARRFDYDRYGNRTGVWDAVSGGTKLQNTAIAEVTGVKTNRIASVNGGAVNYDASGNITADGGKTFTYDALNRIVTVEGAANESYSYDAANHRVKTESGGVVTHYIWEGSQVIAEYEYGGNNTPAKGSRYYHQDLLSTRLITDGSGSVVGTMDTFPFGEVAGGGGESDKRKFTSYERDATGLDYAVNRHYSSAQGRFTQVDPIGMGAVSLGNPQTLNLYAYCANDPVNFADPLGLNKALCEELKKILDDWSGWPLPDNWCGDDSGGGGGGGNDGGGSSGEGPEPEKKDCSSLAPSGFTNDKADAVLKASKKTGVDPTLLAATWQLESSLNYYPDTNPNDGTLYNADVGPVQINYKTWAGILDMGYGLDTNEVFGYTLNSTGDFAINRSYSMGKFNGYPLANLAAAGYILGKELGGTKSASASARSNAAAYYRTGQGAFLKKKKGQDEFNKRKNAFDSIAPKYDAYFKCLEGK